MNTYITVQKEHELDGLCVVAREAAIENVREGIRHDSQGLSIWAETEQDILVGLGFEGLGEGSPKIYYSLNHCQGDGATINARINAKRFAHDVLKTHAYDALLASDEGECDTILAVCFQGGDNHYVHAYTVDVSFIEDGAPWGVEELAKKYDAFMHACKQWAIEYGLELEERGYEELDYQDSEEYIVGFIGANELRFDTDGGILHSFGSPSVVPLALERAMEELRRGTPDEGNLKARSLVEVALAEVA